MKTSTFTLSYTQLHWLSAALMMVMLPHINHLAVWVMPMFCLLLLWRYLATYQRVPLPPTYLRLLVTGIALLGIVLSYGTLLGRDAGVALLVLLIGLKLLELHSLRDAMLISFLSYFLILTNFLYSQTIPQALYLLLVVLVSTAALVSFSDHNERLQSRQRLRLAGTLVLQALPLMMLMFLLFPRIPGPFWGLPQDAFAGAQTGFSDSLRLGNISQLALSDEVAFRVKFDGQAPPANQLYWRGVVLPEQKDGEWIPGVIDDGRQPNLLVRGEPIDYTITLEPHKQHWLFALDLPSDKPTDIVPRQIVRLLPEYQLHMPRKLATHVQYRLRSYTDYRTQSFSQFAENKQLSQALRLPAGKHPKTHALARAWRNENPDPKALVERALAFFQQEQFYYTLEPPPFIDDPIDEFLFDSRAGFCEHYSAAFVSLMRAASVPARLVVGYQGGSLNALGDYMVVRQRDAHAWTEVWFHDQGWVRVDPTAAVDPSRVEGGIGSALPEVLNDFEHNQNAFISHWWLNLRDRWDALNNQWNQWVLSYGRSQQQDLLERLGLKDWGYKGLVLLLMLALMLLLISTGLWMLRSGALYRDDPIQAAYLRFCQHLARHGVARAAHEGPQHFAQRAQAAYPQQRQAIQHITQLYIALRYQHNAASTEAQTKVLMRSVKRFKKTLLAQVSTVTGETD